jgi:hypothetical protein
MTISYESVASRCTFGIVFDSAEVEHIVGRHLPPDLGQDRIAVEINPLGERAAGPAGSRLTRSWRCDCLWRMVGRAGFSPREALASLRQRE